MADLDELRLQLYHRVQSLPSYPVPRRTVLSALPRLHTLQPLPSLLPLHPVLHLVLILVDVLDLLVPLHLLLLS